MECVRSSETDNQVSVRWSGPFYPSLSSFNALELQNTSVTCIFHPHCPISNIPRHPDRSMEIDIPLVYLCVVVVHRDVWWTPMYRDCVTLDTHLWSHSPHGAGHHSHTTPKCAVKHLYTGRVCTWKGHCLSFPVPCIHVHPVLQCKVNVIIHHTLYNVHVHVCVGVCIHCRGGGGVSLTNYYKRGKYYYHWRWVRVGGGGAAF